jgi:hydroxyacylglutathione hydrolase
LDAKRPCTGAVIDPGDDADRILAEVKTANLRIERIINTHGHFDHVGANRQLKAATGAELMIHPLDAPMLEQLDRMAGAFGLKAENSPAPDRLLEDGETIAVGNLQLDVIHTPGHTPGGISLYTDGSVFVGDTLFPGLYRPDRFSRRRFRHPYRQHPTTAVCPGGHDHRLYRPRP